MMTKTPVAILGATGAVGQNLVALLQDHPWFEIVALGASERTIGMRYGDVWRIEHPLSDAIANMAIRPCIPDMPCEWVFSSLDSSVAGEIESAFAHAGYQVVSNSRNHRMDPRVPLLIPEVNPEQLKLLETQTYGKGSIITNPNCVVVGLAIALKPLVDRFGVDTVSVTTLQAISGAGFYGLDPDAIKDNVIPHITNEEEKIETETIKILGPMRITAQCNRVPVKNGHTLCVNVKLRKETTAEEIRKAWNDFKGVELPLAPEHPILVRDEAPEPKHHLKPMEVVVGRLRPCPLGGWKFIILCDNQIRGAAGCAILNAELLLTQKSTALVN